MEYNFLHHQSKIEHYYQGVYFLYCPINIVHHTLFPEVTKRV